MFSNQKKVENIFFVSKHIFFSTSYIFDYHIAWDVDSLDWKDISTQQIVERVTRNVKNGSIVLFHNNAKHVTEYLPLIIEKLQAEGYEIVPIGELIHKQNYHINHEGRQIAD